MNVDRRLLGFMRGAGATFALAVAAGVAAAAAWIAQARLLSRGIAALFLEQAPAADARALLAVFLGLAVARGIALWIGRQASHAVGAHARRTARERLVDHLRAAGPVALGAERSGELAGAAGGGLETFDAYFGQYLPQLLLAAAVPLLVLCFAAVRDPLSGLILFLTAPLLPLFLVLIGRLARTATQRRWKTLGRLGAHFLDVLQGLPMLKLLGRSGAEEAEVTRVGEQYRRSTMRVLRVAFLSAFALEGVATLGVAIVAVAIGVRLLYGRMGFEDGLFVLLLAPEFYAPLRQLGAGFHAGLEGAAAGRRVLDLLAVPAAAPAVPAAAPTPPAGPVRFEEVSFRYPGAPDDALRGVSFALAEGGVTALVGPSGAGKSTAAQLLLALARPTAGRLTVGDCDLADLDPDAWRRRVGWVPQRPYLFHGTIEENLRLARPDAPADALEAAARAAHLHDWIARQPRGYETAIGERGARLSGGEAQRLALARAFLRDAPLLVLDEPTSALDPEIEERIRDAMARLMAGRTVLLIAHRLGAARHADRVVVLREGRVAEQGAAPELAAGDGLFAAFCRAAAAAGAGGVA